VWSQELDLVILVDPFQPVVVYNFCDCFVAKCHKAIFITFS